MKNDNIKACYYSEYYSEFRDRNAFIKIINISIIDECHGKTNGSKIKLL